MMQFCFTLNRNESKEFEWGNSESTIIKAFDMGMAVREFKDRYKHDIQEIAHYEGEDSGFVVYLNSVDGAELVFDID